MTDRDRLRNIFSKFADGTYNGSGIIIDGTKVDDVVDELLANGVIVPPCKVGDKVYFIDYHFKIIEEVNVYGYTTKFGKLNLLIKGGIYNGVISEWYNTKEEAEAKLKELNDNANRD